MPVPIAMLPLASASAALWSALAVVVGSIIVGGTAFYFMRARFQERIEAPRATNLASSAAPVPIQAEVRAIGKQIEKAMSEQRLQGETQRQILSQKLDSVRQSVEAQRNQVDGLRHELRHEIRRRDEEMTDIKHQIASIRTEGALPPAPSAPALPPASTETAAAPAAVPAGPSTFEEVSLAPPAEEAGSAFEEVALTAPAAPEPSTFEEVSFETVELAPVPGETFVEVTFPPSADDGPAAPDEAADDSIFEPWAPEPEGDSLADLTWIARPGTEPAAVFGAAEPAGEALADGPTAVPDGADDLTVITLIDEDVQRRLYAEGVTTLDEIACWGRADARRIADAVGVFEDVIVNQWVVEAQAALFTPPA